MKGFTLICGNCWEAQTGQTVDNCQVHHREDGILFKCLNCGYEEFIDMNWQKNQNLLKEKRSIQRQLKRMKN